MISFSVSFGVISSHLIFALTLHHPVSFCIFLIKHSERNPINHKQCSGCSFEGVSKTLVADPTNSTLHWFFLYLLMLLPCCFTISLFLQTWANIHTKVGSQIKELLFLLFLQNFWSKVHLIQVLWEMSIFFRISHMLVQLFISAWSPIETSQTLPFLFSTTFQALFFFLWIEFLFFTGTPHRCQRFKTSCNLFLVLA